MTPRALRPETWSRPALRLLLTLVLVCSFTLVDAWAGDNPIRASEFPKMIEDLVKGDPALREGVLSALKDTPVDSHPQVYAEVLGKIFRNPDLTRELAPEAKRELFAVMIQHLADDLPEAEDSEVILLSEAFLPHMVTDPELVDRLLASNGLRKDYKTKERKGWQRILKRARELLTDNNDELRRAAIRISARCECDDTADTLAALYDALKNAKQPLPTEDGDAFLDAAESLLHHRFPDAGQLLTFLEPFTARFEARGQWTDADRMRLRGDLLEAVIKVLKDKGGAQMSSAKRAALGFGSELIAKASKPEDLAVFFDPDKERFVELQRTALAAASGRMKPEANEAWAKLLTSALIHSEDRDVLQGTLAIIGPTFKKGSEVTQRLAAAVASRLEQRAETDDPAQREALAAILGDIGSRADVLTALVNPLDMYDAKPEDVPVYSQLIRALGRVNGGFVVTLEPYYVSEGTRRSPDWQRLAVAKALGAGGIRDDELQGKLAGLFLRHILTGDAVTSDENVQAGVPAEPLDGHLLRDETSAEGNADVRAAAIESLRWYPSVATATVLARIAGEATPAGKRALTILGRQMQAGSLEAAEALADLVTEGAAPELITSIFDVVLGADAPATDAAKDSLAEAARRILGSAEADADLRLKAADVSAHLADAKALGLVRKSWAGEEKGSDARQAWGERLQALFVAAAERGRDDLVLADELQDIANDGMLDDVIAFFEKMGKAADRFELKLKHAEIYNQRGTDTDRTPEQQRKDLDQAIRLYGQLVPDAPSKTMKLDIRSALFETLVRRSQPERIAEGEKAAEFQLRAYKVAADSGDRDFARRALEAWKNVLSQSQQLSEAQRGEVARVTKQLEAVAEGANGGGKKKGDGK